ncbi:MAG: hypothetical protein JNK37_09375 [Verrucomicrobiales bacterium]|nr:hypothetical protein [Verrucomicrobiales bacterium]
MSISFLSLSKEPEKGTKVKGRIDFACIGDHPIWCITAWEKDQSTHLNPKIWIWRNGIKERLPVYRPNSNLSITPESTIPSGDGGNEGVKYKAGIHTDSFGSLFEIAAKKWSLFYPDFFVASTEPRDSFTDDIPMRKNGMINAINILIDSTVKPPEIFGESKNFVDAQKFKERIKVEGMSGDLANSFFDFYFRSLFGNAVEVTETDLESGFVVFSLDQQSADIYIELLYSCFSNRSLFLKK